MTDELGETRTKKGGRPTPKEIAKHKADCKTAFYNGIGVLKASDKLGLNKNTVSDYYSEFRKEFVDKLDKDFVAEQKTAKQISIFKLDEAIEEADSAMKIALKKSVEIAGPKEPPVNQPAWYGHYIKCMEIKCSLQSMRYNLEMSPTIDVDVRKYTQEELKKIETGRPE